ncbi:FAD-dependent oxidoreductase, partial [Kaarinaea lacus]
MKVIIVGGSAGGASVAARLRRLDETAEITIIEKSATISFATCGIPYYLGGVISDRQRLNVVEEEEFVELLNVDVRTNSELIAIDRSRKKVLVKDNQNGTLYEQSYDKLVLAPGGLPVIPDVEGATNSNVFTLRNAEDTDYAYNYVKENDCQTALIVGAGFIGLELAENLRTRGINVHVLDNSNQVMGAWDYEMAAVLQQHLRSKNVNLVLNDSLNRITDNGAELESGVFLAADVIFLCIGVKPNNRLARHCRLEIGSHGGIKVDQRLITSDEDIFALGDAIEVQNNITNQQSLIPLAGIAQKQARIVADNICGMHKVFDGAHGNAIAKVFDLTIGIAGLSEQEIKSKSINYQKSYIETLSHAGFYPDSFPLIIKLLFTARTGRILGAQIVGSRGVDKRIDVFASAIKFERTIHDLAELELAYAPPFSSAKDPVNLIAMTSINMQEHDYQVIHWDELDDYVSKGALLLDVRTLEEYELGCLDGAMHIPLGELRSRYQELPFDKTIVVYCQQGKKGYFASRILKQYGFNDVRNLSGGQKLYKVVQQERSINQTLKRFSASIVPIPLKSTKISDSNLNEEQIDPRNSDSTAAEKVRHIDVTGMTCPGPIMHVKKQIINCAHNELIKISTTDPGFVKDIKIWVLKMGHELVSI